MTRPTIKTGDRVVIDRAGDSVFIARECGEHFELTHEITGNVIGVRPADDLRLVDEPPYWAR